MINSGSTEIHRGGDMLKGVATQRHDPEIKDDQVRNGVMQFSIAL